tara:strand:- start:793 stop:1950 length:1158 start_codon:yes stop_codon:yes gene_type:complete
MSQSYDAGNSFGVFGGDNLDRPVHGGIKPYELRGLGLNPEEVLDFSASVSPTGQPVGLFEALSRADLSAYPDPSCLELKEVLAQYLSSSHASNIVPEQILIGNGSTELIHLIARSMLIENVTGSSPSVLIFTPTYSEYEGACRLVGADIHEFCADRNQRLKWDISKACDQIRDTSELRLVFLCNPNNPTGVYLDAESVTEIAFACSSVQALLIIDEAYLNFVDDPWDSLGVLALGNIILLRSMTKDYGLTGLRLGYSLASSSITTRLRYFQPDWSVNTFAQIAGKIALNDGEYLTNAKMVVNAAKDYLQTTLESMGFFVYPSTANFLLIDCGDGGKWHNYLMRKGLFVRDCASFGLPECIRVGIRAIADCEKLVKAIASAKDSHL